jgi:two-component system, cell cycle response regulator
MKKILCIDDLSSNLFTIENVLMSAANKPYEVFTATSAQEGLAILLQEEINLILLDIMMPQMDGFECAKMILLSKKTKDIPIIFVTAKKDDTTISRCYEVGGMDYVVKPFNEVELLARVSFHLMLKEKEKIIQSEKEYAQNVLDLQENLIVITDGYNILNGNKSLLNFYNLNSISEFQDKHICICRTFVEEEGYFHLGLVKDDIWVEEIIKLSSSQDILVKINLNEEYIFLIDAVKYSDYYIVTLTNTTKLLSLYHSFEHGANYDELTQIYNKRVCNEIINSRINSKRKSETIFSLIIFDIDFFKRVNDNYGHIVGDNVLKKLASTIKSHIRNNDILARWGGEEFVLIVQEDIKTAFVIAENLRKRIENIDFDIVKHITCSFGVTQYLTKDNLESIINRADEAMYMAKESGRNRVCSK